MDLGDHTSESLETDCLGLYINNHVMLIHGFCVIIKEKRGNIRALDWRSRETFRTFDSHKLLFIPKTT